MAIRKSYLVRNYAKGWRGNSEKHRLAALGIRTGRRSRSTVSPFEIRDSIAAVQEQNALDDRIKREEESIAYPQSIVEEEEDVYSPIDAQDESFGQEAVVADQTILTSEDTLPGQDVGASVIPTPAAPPLFSRKGYMR